MSEVFPIPQPSSNRQIYSPNYGTVQSAKMIADRFTGQSRGFTFVEMVTSEEAQKAIASLHGTD
ncbi:MAG TPA: hypothetical protein VI359_06255 [Nitrospiraceae bacterium]